MLPAFILHGEEEVVQLKISELMSKQVLSVSKGSNLEEVINFLSRHNISGVPVVDEENKMVGIISEKDIINFSREKDVLPFTRQSGWIAGDMSVTDMMSLEKSSEILGNTRVEEVMTRDVVTVHRDSQISELAAIMKQKNINRIPVIDDTGQLVGIITRADLVNYLADKEKYLR